MSNSRSIRNIIKKSEKLLNKLQEEARKNNNERCEEIFAQLFIIMFNLYSLRDHIRGKVFLKECEGLNYLEEKDKSKEKIKKLKDELVLNHTKLKSNEYYNKDLSDCNRALKILNSNKEVESDYDFYGFILEPPE